MCACVLVLTTLYVTFFLKDPRRVDFCLNYVNGTAFFVKKGVSPSVSEPGVGTGGVSCGRGALCRQGASWF